MERMRAPFQGVLNIIRFNWHFYILSAVSLLLLMLLSYHLGEPYSVYLNILCALAILVTLISLIVSYYVYDFSDLYQLTWLPEIPEGARIINIHAGFDETSMLLQEKFPASRLTVFDFYDPQRHTEVSIRRARRAYPPFPETQHITTSHIPVADGQADIIFVILAAHEIRAESERDIFFAELRRILSPSGKILVVEHLRDAANFAAYSIGFFHFIPRASWLRNFDTNGLTISAEISITPFITTFVLSKHGNTP